MENNSLRIICLEDNLKDAELIIEVLIEAGYQIDQDLTSTKNEFESLIRKNQYDIILSDFKLPGFDAFGALKLCKAICPDIPFICVSGSIGEEIAIELLKQGAVDYILKDRLARLPFAIKRALDEAKEKVIIKEVEKELTESEQRYRTLYENAKIGLYRTTPDGKILLANKTLIRMLGYQSFEELTLKDLNKDGFSSSYKRKIFIDRIEKEGEVNDFESEWVCKDGTAIFVRESAQAIRDSDGKIIYYDGIVENITERKSAEEALKKSKEKLKELFEDAPVGYHEIDELGNISAVNNTELKLLGYSLKEMIGYPVWNFSENVEASRERVIEKLAGILPPNKNLEQFFIRKDGTAFPALVDDVIFRNDKGIITGIRTTILDITQRKKIEHELKELSLLHQAILASVPDIIMEVDNNKIYTWANNAGKEFFGNDVIGKEAAYYFEGEQEVYTQVQPLFNGYENIIYVESWQRRRDGEIRLLAWWCKVLKDINGNPTGALSSARDITEQKKAEDDLRESERKLAEAQKIAQLGYWSWDIKTGDVEWSDEVFKIFQLDPKTFKPQIDSILEKSPWPEDHERDKELIKKAMESREKGSYEQRFLRPDNSIGYYISSFQGKYDEEGNLITIIGTIQDITERKQIENKLKDSEEKFRTIFENSASALEIIEKDSTISMVNKEYCKISGYTKEEVIGTSWTERVPEIELEKLKDYNRKRLIDPKSVPDSYDLLVYGKDGSLKNCLLSVAVIPETQQTVCSFIDITAHKRAEKALRISEERLRIILDATNIAVWDWDLANNSYYSSPSTYSMLGLEYDNSPEFLEHWMDRIHPDDCEMIKEVTKKIFTREADNYDYNARFKHADGSYHWLNIQGYVIQKDESGNPLRLSGIQIDITERRQAEEKVNHLAAIVQSSDDAIIGKTLDGYIINWNKGAESIYGYSEKEAVGQHISIIMPPGSYNEADEILEMIKDGSHVEHYETVRYNKNGKPINVSLTISPIKNAAGKIIAASTIARDITERKKAEEALRESEERLRITLEVTNIGIWDWDIRNDNYYASPTFYTMLGYKPVQGLSDRELWSERIHPDDRKMTEEKLQNVLTGTKNEYQYEARLKHADGTYRWCNVFGYPVEWDKNKRPTRLIGIRIDITERKKTEEVLHNERLLLRTLIDNIPDSIYAKDLDFRKTLANPAEVQIMNAEAEAEVLGKNDFDCYPKEIAGKFYTDDKLVLQGTPVFNKEEYILDKNGKKQWLLTSKLPLYDKDKNVIGLVGIGRNITARKISEDRQFVISNILSILNRPNEWQEIIKDILYELKEFTELEALAIRLQEGNDYPYYVVNGFSKTFVETENSLCTNQLNRDKDDEKPHLDCFCDNVIYQRYDSSKSFYTESGSFWTNNMTELIDKYSENELLASSRNICNKEGYKSVALIPLQSGDKVIGLLQLNDKRPNMFTLDMIQFFEKIGSTIGIAFKRMQIEKQIKESEERYRFIVDATNDVIYRLKYHSMKYDFISSAIEKLTGYTPDEINEIGFKNIVVKISKYHVENVNVDLIVENRELGKTGEWQADYQVRRKDGRLIWLTDHSYPWYNESGEVIGSIGILGNITERKNAEEEIIRAKEKAEEMNRLKSNFLANMSHELRTPLIGILGFADMLKEDLVNDPREEYAQIILDSGLRLKDTLNLILDLSKIESKGLEMKLEEIEITKYVPDLVKVFRQTAEQKNIALKIIPSDELILCNLDKTLLDSIINNLMNNAVKYTQKGSITLSVQKKTLLGINTAEIQIADTGIGISKENLEIIFEPFRQVSEGLNRRFEGTGLGLTLVKKYVEQMGGSISVKSEPGAGSTFAITFPVIKLLQRKTEQSIGGDRIMETLKERETKNKIRVLYVEDDFVSQKVINSLIGKMYDLDFSSDGETALEMVRKKKYDIILMDINLRSNLNGLVVTKEIKKIQEYANTPIIAVTAYAMIGDKEKILMEGCTHYISKPFSKNEILTLLNEVLNN